MVTDDYPWMDVALGIQALNLHMVPALTYESIIGLSDILCLRYTSGVFLIHALEIALLISKTTGR